MSPTRTARRVDTRGKLLVACWLLAGCGATGGAGVTGAAGGSATPCGQADPEATEAQGSLELALAPASTPVVAPPAEVVDRSPEGLVVQWAGHRCALRAFGVGADIEPVLAENMALLPVLGRILAVELGACVLAWELPGYWLLDVSDGVAWVWHGAHAASEPVGHLRWVDLRTGAEILHRTVDFRPDAPSRDGPALRVPLFVERRDDSLVVAARCGRSAALDCPTWVGAFDRAGNVRWSAQTSSQLPLVSASARGVAIDTAGAVEVRAWASGEVIERFALGAAPYGAALDDDGTYLWWDATALHARDTDGRERWVVAGARFVASSSAGVLATTFDDVRLVDRSTGATTCRRMGDRLGGPPRDMDDYVRRLCERAGLRTGAVAGAVFVDGAPRAGVRIQLGDQEVVTDRRGRFRAEFGAVGRVRVQLPSPWVGRRCATIARDVHYVDLADDGRDVSLVLDIVTDVPRCHGGCDDCR